MWLATQAFYLLVSTARRRGCYPKLIAAINQSLCHMVINKQISRTDYDDIGYMTVLCRPKMISAQYSVCVVVPVAPPAYLWAAVFASNTPAPCIHVRTAFIPAPMGSSFILLPLLWMLSWIPNMKTDSCHRLSRCWLLLIAPLKKTRRSVWVSRCHRVCLY